MASFGETDAASEGKGADLTGKSEKNTRAETSTVSESSHHKEKSPQSQEGTKSTIAGTAVQVSQSSSKAPEGSEPAGSGKSSEVKSVTSQLVTGQGNIVDYPITPESSEEEEQMDTGAGAKERQPESQTCQQDSSNPSSDQSGSKEHVTQVPVETMCTDEESRVVDKNLAESKTMDIVPQLDEHKDYIYGNTSFSSDDESVVTVPEVHVKPKQVLHSGKDMTEQDINPDKEEEPTLHEQPKEDLNSQRDIAQQNINTEKEEKELQHTPMAEGDFNNGANVRAEDKIETEAVSAEIDDTETASQGSAEFQPQLDDPYMKDSQEGSAESSNMQQESDTKVADADKSVSPETKVDVPESMDVDGEEYIQDVDEVARPPPAAVDVEEVGGTPAVQDVVEAVGIPAAALIVDEAVGARATAHDVDEAVETPVAAHDVDEAVGTPAAALDGDEAVGTPAAALDGDEAVGTPAAALDGDEAVGTPAAALDGDEAVGTPAAALDGDEAVGTPAAALDGDEAVGTPIAALDVEDGDSLLPDTELQERKPAVSKSGGFPITEAFMDENSLSLDCVLGMSSTVPEGDVSMDINICSKECPTPAKRSRPGSVMSGVEPDVDDDGTFPAENLFEYQWPLDGGEWYMLQEQISEYLQIKSFKRKYPDLYRRTCDKNEKDFLRERLVVSETQCDLGLTALRSEEVYDLMHKDYQEKYREYAHVLHEKERQTINNKHKEYEVPKLDKGKMGAYIKKAVKAAADFNAQFQRERREERRAYFDMQTFMIQYPAGRYKKLPPEHTKPGAHPVSLIPGQFQNYYCKYTSDELKYLPLNTAVFDPPKRMSNTLVKPTSDQESSEVEDSTEDKAGSASDGESDGDGSSDSDESDSDAEEETKSKEEVLAVPLVEEKCRICNSADPPPPEKKVSRSKKGKQEKPIATDDQEMIKCSECGTVGHPSCLDLTNAMVSVIRTYPWQCMECKTCVECMDPYDEDKMMFCDRCDRGYHTFCVGLRSIPTGRWECRSCKGTDTPRARKRTSLAK